MSVLIKGMKMPKDGCKGCPFAVRLKGFVSHTCAVNGKLVAGNHERGGFPFDCPLVPVPPHGRLIDADAIVMDYIGIMDDGMNLYTQRAIDNAPTIIPACEEVYDKYTDTAGNLHWTGTHSGKHIISAEED